MKKAFLFVLTLLIATTLCASPSRAATVRVDVIHSQDRYEVGSSHPLLFSLSIADKWYIHGPVKEGDLIPTEFTFDEQSRIRIEDLVFPMTENKKFDYFSETVALFSGEILVKGTLVVPQDLPCGEHVLKGKISYQACSASSCLPPANAAFSVKMHVVPPGSATKAVNQETFLAYEKGITTGDRFGPGLLLTLIGFFVGGLTLNLTPCIYPLIPITVSYFGGKDQGRRATVIHAFLYLVGLAVMNSALGVWASLSG
ncbi:MAG: cytochrome c biogenesis protein CcdA, partial [Deltaproteobacteria bacterium]